MSEWHTDRKKPKTKYVSSWLVTFSGVESHSRSFSLWNDVSHFRYFKSIYVVLVVKWWKVLQCLRWTDFEISVLFRVITKDAIIDCLECVRIQSSLNTWICTERPSGILGILRKVSNAQLGFLLWALHGNFFKNPVSLRNRVPWAFLPHCGIWHLTSMCICNVKSLIFSVSCRLPHLCASHTKIAPSSFPSH